jgi:heterodisulfide reductase subunit B
MNTFAFFMGCGIPSNENNYELATRRLLEKIGVELMFMPGAGCCGHDLEQIDRPTFLAWAARNLCIAEGMKKDVMVLCPSCYLTLRSVNDCLKGNEKERQETNEMLSKIDTSFQGNTNVIHYVDYLLKDDVFPRLKDKFTRSLAGLSVGIHYGCHLLRPQRVIGFDDPVVPSKIDRLVEATGATSLSYLDKTMCCGMPLLGTDMKSGLRIASSKLNNVRKAGANVMVTACPVCHMMFDGNQSMMNKILNENHHTPVIHLAQLLGLAAGLSFEDVGLHKNKEDVNGIREIIG